MQSTLSTLLMLAVYVSSHVCEGTQAVSSFERSPWCGPTIEEYLSTLPRVWSFQLLQRFVFFWLMALGVVACLADLQAYFGNSLAHFCKTCYASTIMQSQCVTNDKLLITSCDVSWRKKFSSVLGWLVVWCGGVVSEVILGCSKKGNLCKVLPSVGA